MITCSWSIPGGGEGATKGVSWSQILNNAIAKWISSRKGCSIGSAQFRLERAQLGDVYVDIVLDPMSLKRMRELYSLSRQGCASAEEQRELLEFQNFFNARQQYALKHNRKSA